VVAALAERAIGFKSLTEQIDTTTPGGKLIFHGSVTVLPRPLRSGVRSAEEPGCRGEAWTK